MYILFENNFLILNLFVKLQNVINLFDLIISPKYFLFGIYKTDLLLLKLKYSNII
jgi:hypothetical protein